MFIVRRKMNPHENRCLYGCFHVDSLEGLAKLGFYSRRGLWMNVNFSVVTCCFC